MNSHRGIKLAAMLTALAATLLPACQSVSEKPAARPANRNRELVLSFYNEALMERRPRSAFERFAAPSFVDHKAEMPVGSRSSASDYLEGLIKRFPDPHWEIVRTVAEGNLVVLHVRFKPTATAEPYAIVDIFRVENDQLVEHWDVVSEPPEVQRNPNSRF